MSVYIYKGVNKLGKNVSGTIDAENQKGAKVKLKQKGIFVVALKEKGAADLEAGKKSITITIGKKVSTTDLTTFTRQFATLVNSNVPIVETLDALSEQVENQKLKVIITEVKQKVNEGCSIAEAIKVYPDVFSTLFVNMVRAGEASSTLGLVLFKLADYTERQAQMRNKIISSLTYPLLMLVIGVLVVGIMFVVVIPKITAIFESMEATLPIYTKILINVSSFVSENYMYIILFILLFIYLFQKYAKSPKGKESLDTVSLKIPILGKIVRMTQIARFTSTLSTLHGAGVPLLQALDIVSKVVSNTVIKNELVKARDAVQEGQSLGATLQKSGEFPPIVVHMITVGEKTGELETMLSHVSNSYENEVAVRLNTLTSLLEPAMLVIMGGGVAFIVMAILVPITQLSSNL